MEMDGKSLMTASGQILGVSPEPQYHSAPQVPAEQFAELHRVSRHHFSRMLLFVVLYVPAAVAAWQIAETWPGEVWVYLACLPLYLLAAASLHGISLFTHEGVHGTLSLSPGWNRFWSVACALPVGQNFAA